MIENQSPGSIPAGEGTADDDARLRELGYEQRLSRRLGVFGSVAMGFATISPVVGLYAVAVVGTVVAGPAWVWTLPVCLLGQCLLLTVYSELASQFPIAGGPYQWTRRLIGPSYAWLTGWVSLCGYLAANTTIAYLSTPWILGLFEITPSPRLQVAVAAAFILVCSVVNSSGIDVLRRVLNVGIAAEALASVGVGVALLLAFRTQPWSLLTDTMGAEALSGGSVFAAMLAALAVGGWAFIGFDATTMSSEETRNAARHVPRAIWWALLSVGGLVILNAFATVLAHPDPAAVVAGKDVDPVTTAVLTSFGDWSAKPFLCVVIVAFLACGLAAQGASARAVYSVARDGVLPAARFLSSVNRRHAPIGGTIAVTLVGWAGLLLALDSSAIGSLITFGTAGLYMVFFLVALAALVSRVRGTWTPAGHIRLGTAGTVINALAVVWLGFQFVNITWPRTVLAPPGAPWYQIWAAPLVSAGVLILGLLYLVIARPQDRVRTGSAFATRPAEAAQ
ncbi:amino acid permease [Actinomadura spongiicola]|uniref:Amino acid permease n=1 Tax=Actinomadura spongiicola TaxID=2303421 RepID=A0A372GPJ3_9ACTN|nr:APC family permease [Actinomadura spongiicola]RFS87318.1 amino acid permease [Actinomadura spongiicola]